MSALTAWLVEQGHLAPDGTSRKAKLRRCPTCRRQILTGDDDDRCAFTARADPHPLTELGEALALLAGRTTYSLARTAGGVVLWRRDVGQIRRWPASTHPSEDVLAEHRCDLPAPSGPLLAVANLARPTVADLPPGSPAPF